MNNRFDGLRDDVFLDRVEVVVAVAIDADEVGYRQEGAAR
jgi:hypothetical protein